MTKKKETLPTGVIAQDEFTKEKDEEQTITKISLRLDFKVRDLTCDSKSIAEDTVSAIVEQFYNNGDDDCLWARAQVLEREEV